MAYTLQPRDLSARDLSGRDACGTSPPSLTRLGLIASLLLRRRPRLPPVLTFEENLCLYLNGLGVTAYQDHVPQYLGSVDAYVVNLVTGSPRYTIAAASGLDQRNYQISCFSATKLNTIKMESALRKCLSGYRGSMGSTRVSGSRLVNCLDMPYEPSVDGSDNGTYHRMSEYQFFLSEPIPTF